MRSIDLADLSVLKPMRPTRAARSGSFLNRFSRAVDNASLFQRHCDRIKAGDNRARPVSFIVINFNAAPQAKK